MRDIGTEIVPNLWGSSVRFSSLQTPVGLVFVGVSDGGVCDVTFNEPNEDRYRDRLAGTLRRFTVEVDLRAITAFTALVLRVTCDIPFGQVLCYGDVANRIGAPKASRAVGGALGRNPVPIIVPCHRVVAQGGRLGGFTGGLETKRTLLRIEGHAISTPGRLMV